MILVNQILQDLLTIGYVEVKTVYNSLSHEWFEQSEEENSKSINKDLTFAKNFDGEGNDRYYF